MRKEVAVDIHQQQIGMMMWMQKILPGLMKGLHLETIQYHKVMCNGLALPISNYSVHQEVTSSCGIQSFAHPTFCLPKIFLYILFDLCLGFSSGVIP
jgi:hypothetical protein